MVVDAKTKKGTPVFVHYIDDVEPNKGGLYCMVSLEPQLDVIYDDFCIHPSDTDCNDDSKVESYIRDFISLIDEY